MGTAGQLIVKRYRLVRALGQGDMGIVWEGHDMLLDRPVAVRQVLLPPALGEVRRLRLAHRVAREARQAERLRHPNIAAVYDVAEEDGTPYIVMELVRARSLDGIVASDGPLPAERATAVARKILAALAHAHAQGVRHGDVRPSNVLITHDGRVLLADFGIAALAADPAFSPEHPPVGGEPAGAGRGTRAFLAPERADGGALTPAADLWSLGATLHFAITGSPPGPASHGPTPPAARRPDPDDTLHGGPDKALRAVVDGLLRRDPRERLDPRTADRLLAEIEPAVPPPAAVRSPTRLSRTRRARLIGAIAAVAAVAGVVGGWAVLWPRPAATESQIPATAPPTDHAEPTPTPSAATAQPLKLRWHHSSAGWRAAVPRGWTVRRGKFSTWWLDPEGRAQFHIEVTAQSGTDPLGTLREAESLFHAKDYRRLRLTTVATKYGTAADWEFTWTRDKTSAKTRLVKGTAHHQLRRVISTGTTTSVLTWTTTTGDWERLLPTLTKVLAHFQPPER